MADDYQKNLPAEQVAAWYRRLADSLETGMPGLQPALAGVFLRTWLDNRSPGASIEFDAPDIWAITKIQQSDSSVDRYERHRTTALAGRPE